MGVSRSSAFSSPPLQARGSVLTSSAADSPGCAALCIAMGCYYTAAWALKITAALRGVRGHIPSRDWQEAPPIRSGFAISYRSLPVAARFFVLCYMLSIFVVIRWWRTLRLFRVEEQ